MQMYWKHLKLISWSYPSLFSFICLVLSFLLLWFPLFMIAFACWFKMLAWFTLAASFKTWYCCCCCCCWRWSDEIICWVCCSFEMWFTFFSAKFSWFIDCCCCLLVRALVAAALAGETKPTRLVLLLLRLFGIELSSSSFCCCWLLAWCCWLALLVLLVLLLLLSALPL